MGTQVREFPLFKDPHRVSADEILSSIAAQIRPQTRVLGMTWVQSGSGVKLPIREIGKLVRELNQKRDEQDRIIYVVDGVHGFGVEDVSFADFDCDYFIAGTHKWLFGPRGTGVIIARSEQLQEHLVPSIPTFSRADNFGTLMTPGGYHAFEHRLALGTAFELHLQLGKAEVQARIHQLNAYLKQRLGEHPKVRLVTPTSRAVFGLHLLPRRRPRLRGGRQTPDGAPGNQRRRGSRCRPGGAPGAEPAERRGGDRPGAGNPRPATRLTPFATQREPPCTHYRPWPWPH